MRKKRVSRVDVQVTIITAVIMIVAFVCVYFFNYNITHEDMIHSLKQRSNSIYHYVDKYVDKAAFNDETAISMDQKHYKELKKKLEDVKIATDVMYLYTAKKTADGEYIYLVDGLSSKSSDFRKPGDSIEPEIIPEMKSALENNIILPDKIKATTWGYIFVSYYPIHDQGKVVGVLGIEFDASHQYRAYQIIRWGTPLIAIGACLIAMLLAVYFFRRISNPNYKDMSNSDYLTGLKNRNAFEIDMLNLEERKEQPGFIVTDINDLKKVNDENGHSCGDRYIRGAAAILMRSMKECAIYRYGGDEFIIIMPQLLRQEVLQGICENIYKTQDHYNKETGMQVSLSIGCAAYDEEVDHSLRDTLQRADENMYEVKRRYKDEKQEEQ